MGYELVLECWVFRFVRNGGYDSLKQLLWHGHHIMNL